MSPGEDEVRRDAETELIERAQGGEAEAFEELFQRNRNQIFSLAYRMTGNASDAEDLCQDVFLSAFRKIGTFQGRSSFSTWLYRVGINRSKDYLRKRKRSPEVLSRDEQSPEPALESSVYYREEISEPEKAAVASETQRMVQEALLKLPFNLRAPLVLHELQGLEYREVARLLRLPVGTVKSRIFRARVQLSEILEPYKEQWIR